MNRSDYLTYAAAPGHIFGDARRGQASIDACFD